ncbi:MAG: V-type ATP synthase subunit A [Candidatus Hydrogenedentes bacterium]|nr:V-type ATP synthase subunit A [Candidatus Hydrogenedentota bacterium]
MATVQDPPGAQEKGTAAGRLTGSLIRISGPMIVADGMLGVSMGEIVQVGDMKLMGEIIRIEGDTAFAQVFEDTQGMFLGEPVVATGEPLSVELGPGLLGQTYDGIQRPLITLKNMSGDFIDRGLTAVALDREKKWSFTPAVTTGDEVNGGDVLGTVPETPTLQHHIMVPPGMKGRIRSIKPAGEYLVTDVIATLDTGAELKMMHTWPVKRPRPVVRKMRGDELFLTGQRVLDSLFPIPLGGSAIVPGGFGCGKTVVEQALSKFCNADIIVYVGCGERGNEMADVLDEFPHLTDPKTGGPLMDRTVLVVNTSNMPVAARDASVYTGITLAEYFRDQGYNVALMADSTSRWAEALREISSRLEEMPGEEGYPTYLSARIAEFYERSGRVVCICTEKENEEARIGSVTVVGAVSPPGGDFSEPVTQTSMRVAGALWALDSTLAYRRHYPAVNWNTSYTLYFGDLNEWFEKNAPKGWNELRQRLGALLQRDAELQEVVQLVGPDALQDGERLILETARMVREVFLQQNAFSDNDAFCDLDKSAGLQSAILEFYEESNKLLHDGVSLNRIMQLPARESVARLRDEPNEGFTAKQQTVLENMRASMAELAGQKG